MSENLNNNNASDVESATDIAQFIALLNPIIPTRAYTSFLSANAGFAGSLADLIQKINDGTATRNDFIDVAKDLSGIGTGFATFTNMLGITAIPLPILIGIGVGFAVLDYVDSHNYDPAEMMQDITSIKDSISDWLKESGLFGSDKDYDDMNNLINKFNNADPSDRATTWLTGEGLPWAYNPSTSLTSPLALDLNGDGAISLVSLSKSKTLFDVTGDGMSELTGWIGANDGILVNDTNNNGTIDNITEMFGNQVKINGFVALADKMDTNHDGVVNAQDTNFTSLQVWQDTNQDGISQNSELKTLTELGITEIRTASTPVTSSGDLTCSIADGSFVMNGVEQYVADINFEYNAKITNYVGEYNLSVESLVLPWLRGYGNVKDAEIAYSLDEALQTKAKEMAADPFVASSEFDSFLAQWTGLSKIWQQGGINRSMSTYGDKYESEISYLGGITNRSMLTYDDQAWILENFEGGSGYLKSSIETALKNGTATSHALGTSSVYDTIYIKTIFNQMKEHYFALFMAQSCLEKAFTGSHYSINQDKMVVDDKATLLASLTQWANTHTDSKDEALFAKVLVELGAKLGIGLSDLEATVTNGDFLQLYKDIASGKYASVEFVNGVYYTGPGDDLIYSGVSNDLLEGGSENDTYIFNKSDGKDQIYDGAFKLGSSYDIQYHYIHNAGADTIKFGAGIGQDDLLITQSGKDLIVALKEEGKLFQDLSDKITITDWLNVNNRIENIVFNDGTAWNVAEIMSHVGTDEADTITGIEGDNTIFAKGGDDIINAGSGNDVIDGGSGNDTYIFGRADGKDTVNDSSGNDTLKFKEGITMNDILIKQIGNDLVVGIKEEGKTFAELSDTITLGNWSYNYNANYPGSWVYNTNCGIENFVFSDGPSMSVVDIIQSFRTDGDTIYGDTNAKYAMKFDGADDAIVVRPPANGLNVSTALSVSATFSYEGMGSGYQSYLDGMIVSKGYTNYSASYYFYVEPDGKMLFSMFDLNNGTHAVGSNTIFQTNQTYDVAGTYDKATGMARLYVNGVLDNEVNVGSFDIMQTSVPVVIGAYCANNNGSSLRSYLKGTIDDVQIYNKALSSEEVVTIANGGVAPSALLAHYDFKGDPLVDKSGNNNNGITIGSPVVSITGACDDILMGGNGDDCYIFGKGSGHDTIIDSSGTDTLMLGLGIKREDIITKVVGDNIILGIKEEGKSFEQLSDTITIQNWSQAGFEIENMTFDDGSILNIEDLLITNQAPILTEAEVTVNMQDLRQSTGTIAVTDLDGDTLNYSVTTTANHGTLSVDETGKWNYTATQGYIGIDSATISISDGNGGIVTQVLNFNLSVSAPTITTESATLAEDSILNDALHVNNLIGGALNYEVLNATTHGNFTLNNDGSYSYNPQANYNGADAITIKVTNEYGLTAIKTIDLAITPVNDTPILSNSEDASYILKSTRIATGIIVATDVDGDTLNYTLLTNPAHGKLTLDQNGQWNYESISGYIGNDSATISVSDGNGGIVTKNLNFTVKADNNDKLFGSAGDDIIITGAKNDIIDGSLGNDIIYAGQLGADTLTGGKGNDFLEGGSGNDTYIFNRGDGQDQIYDGYFRLGSLDALNNNSLHNAGSDTLKFGAGISMDDLLITQSGNDLIIALSEEDKSFQELSDKITITNWMDTNNKIEKFLFSDGTSWNAANILSHTGIDESETINGTKTADTIYAKGGDDIINTGAGNDKLYGGDGNDKLYGGLGNDFLQGGVGNDTYYFNKVDGKDTIDDFPTTESLGTNGGEDTIVFGEGLDKNNITFFMKNGNLSVKYGANDIITIQAQNTESSAIERFTLSDGSFMTSNDVAYIIQSMSSYAIDKGIHITSNSTIENNQALMQIVSSGWHNA